MMALDLRWLVEQAANHVWQSTMITTIVWILAIACRHNRASVRSRLWLVASLKWLVPFAAVTALGNAVKWRMSSSLPDVDPSTALSALGRPFTSWTPLVASADIALSSAQGRWPLLVIAVWLTGTIVVLGRWMVDWIRVSRIARRGTVLCQGEEADIFARVTAERGCRHVRLVAIDAAIEPGLFGVVRPVILWPSRLRGRLTSEQATAILEHELCHLSRRDNLVSVLHVLTQAIFWFHPATWWIGRRLVDERERACDETVVSHGCAPHVYATSIIDTCALFVDAKAACVAGVSSANLMKRIETIMTSHQGRALHLSKKLLIATLFAATLAAPFVAGLVSPVLRAQIVVGDARDGAFEVASIKENPNGGVSGPSRLTIQPGGRLLVQNMSVAKIIGIAYGVGMEESARMVGGPSWLGAKAFDIVAKADRELKFGTAGSEELSGMLRTLLVQRFKLKAHKETRELPVYALVVSRKDGKLGPELKPSTLDCTALMNARQSNRGGPPLSPREVRAVESCGLNYEGGQVIAGGIPLEVLARSLSQRLGRVVIDRTKLPGLYDFTMKMDLGVSVTGRPALDPLSGTPLDSDPIVAALENQLGLRVESSKGMVDVLVIDHVELPTEN